jgi:hypothetical protein
MIGRCPAELLLCLSPLDFHGSDQAVAFVAERGGDGVPDLEEPGEVGVSVQRRLLPGVSPVAEDPFVKRCFEALSRGNFYYITFQCMVGTKDPMRLSSLNKAGPNIGPYDATMNVRSAARTLRVSSG